MIKTITNSRICNNEAGDTSSSRDGGDPGEGGGNPVYNRYRSDIADLFPGYHNSDGASGYFYLDTTDFEDGIHTIAWSVEDDAGNCDGIGSRYFTIYNNSPRAQRTAHRAPGRIPDISQIPVDYFNPIKVKIGYNQNIESQTIYPDESGMITIEIRELQRIEIHFSEGTRELAPLPPLPNGSELCTSVVEGFQVIGNRLGTLPIGSVLDGERGVFKWQLGAGYVGDYQFIFLEKNKKKHLRIRIVPKF